MRKIVFLFFLGCFHVFGQDGTSLENLHSELSAAELDEKSQALNDLALYHLSRGAFDSCRHYAVLALETAISFGDEEQMIMAYWYLGRLSLFTLASERSVYYSDKVISLSLKRLDTVRALRALNTKGLALKYMGSYEESANAFLRAKDIGATSNNRHTGPLTLIYCNLGVLYHQLGDVDGSEKLYKQSLAWARENKDSINVRNTLINLGNIFNESGRYDSARSYYYQAAKMGDNVGGDDGMIYTNLAELDFNQQLYDSVIIHAEKVLELDTSSFFVATGLVATKLVLAKTYLALQQYPLAAKHLEEAEELAIKKRKIDYLELIYDTRSEYYETTGQLRKALDYKKKHLLLKDSLFSRELLNKTVRSENKLELSEKEKKIAALEQSNMVQAAKNEKLINWLISAVIFLAMAFGIFYIYILRQRTEKLAIAKEAAENKMEALRNQMNPHFIFNSFNAIQHYILKSDKRQAYKYLTQFAQLLRMILDHASKMSIDLQNELAILKSYVELESLRFQDKFSYKFEVSDDLWELNPTIPSMLVQPYIENAILHGLSNKRSGDGELLVRFSLSENNSVSCLIEDNGIGRTRALKIKSEKEGLHGKNSIAMNNTSDRLQILKKIGYQTGRVNLQDLYSENGEASGTRVTVELSTL